MHIHFLIIAATSVLSKLLSFGLHGAFFANMACDCSILDINNFPGLKEYLPDVDGLQYRICKYNVNPEDPHQFEAVVRMSLSERQEVDDWFKALQAHSKTTWRMNKTYKCNKGKGNRRKNEYRVDYRCHHNTIPRTRSADKRVGSKNTSCSASVYLATKRQGDYRGRVRSSDFHVINGFVTTCTIKNYHNHETHSADALRRRDVSVSTQHKLEELFRACHSPTTALDTLKYDLQVEHGTAYAKLSADRSILPDVQYCFRLYYSLFNKEYGHPSGEKMMLDMEARIRAYNFEQGEVCAKLETTQDGQAVIVICTPLMKRVHKLWPYSAEMFFIDSSGTMDRHNCRVFLLLTHSPAGGLPLGGFVTPSESENTLKFALDMLKSIIPEGAFYGRGAQGPAVFLTDDSSAERMAISFAFPTACILLCTFHLLQAMWRWLWDTKNKIDKVDRPHLLNKLKDMVYAETVSETDDLYEATTGDSVCQRYANYLQHLAKLYQRREVWALAFRDGLSTRNNNTNNFAEAAMRILTEKVLLRAKAYNVCQLVDFLITRFSHYYERKLVDVANNRLDGHALVSRFFPNDGNVPSESVKQISETLYEVKSATSEQVYQVDMVLGMCTCYVGKNGGPCKHQGAVATKFGMTSFNLLPVTSAKTRSLFNKIATGDNTIDVSWFQPLHAGTIVAPHVDETCADTTQPPDEVLQVDSLPTDRATTSSDDDGIIRADSIQVDVNTGSHESLGVPEDPRILAVESLRAQSSLHSQFDQRLTSQSRPNNTCEDLKTGLHDIFAKLEHNLDTNPGVFQSPVKALISNFAKIETEAHLVSALHCFGKYSGPGNTLCRVRRRGLQTSTHIPVQPAAISRRRMQLGGRRRMHRGRPSKAEYANEHGYSKAKAQKLTMSQLPPRQQQRAPHSVAHCVATNVALGKTHSTK